MCIIKDMMNTRRKSIRLYPDIIVVLVLTVFLAVFFTWKFQKSSEEKVLNTLSEISNQSVNVIQEEVGKNKVLLTNMAVYISEGETKDIEKLVKRLKEVDKKNGFKRMGIIRDDHYSIATDGTAFVLDDMVMYERFRSAMDGKTTVSDRLKDLADSEDVTLYSTPIDWEDGTRYVLFGTYSIQYYKDILSISTFSGEGYSYIIKRNGERVIGSENQNGQSFDNYYEWVLQESETNAGKLKEMQENLETGKDGFVKFNTDLGMRYIYYQPLEVNDWYLLSVIPEAVVELHINGPMILAYATVLICVMGILYLAYRVYRIQSKNKLILERAAYVDEVTGEASYAKFKLDAQKILTSCKGQKYAAISMNIQRFQYINDLYGYEEGDRALKRVMHALKKVLNENECAARMQADHFAVLLRYQDKMSLEDRIESILLEIQQKADNRANDMPYELKMCAGVYLTEGRQELIETMLDRAATALRPEYNKEMKPCNFYSDDIRIHMLRNKEIEDRFLEALSNNEFFVCYQPKFDVKREQFCGAEALVRWNTQEKGIISPAIFVPVLEHSGGIVELDEYVLESVCRQMKEWMRRGLAVLPVSVNASQLHLYRSDFVERYLEIIDRYTIPHELIQIEMTETALFSNEDIFAESLERLRNQGIRILMDDFGSGYSSVTMLKSIPVDILKIDKSMVDHVEDNSKVRKILESIISLAQALHMGVTAEGVETKEQYDILKKMQINDVQGFYCAKPMSAEEYTRILEC